MTQAWCVPRGGQGGGREGLVSYGKESPYFPELLGNATDTQVKAKKSARGERDFCMAQFNIPAVIFLTELC